MWIKKDKPTVEDVHVNRPLTNISVAYMQDQMHYVADKVFPMVPVNNKSDVYFTFNKDDFRRNNLTSRAPATESAGGGFRLDASQNYNAKVHAWHFDIPDELRANQDSPLDLDQNGAQFVMQTLLIGREKLWADSFFTTGIWGTDQLNVQWSNVANNPEANVDLGKLQILQATGMKANTLLVSYDTHQALKRHPLVQERFKYTSANSITEQMLAQFFEVERYIVGMASYNSAAEHATAVNQMILSDGALLLYVAPQPSLMLPSAGYNFIWKGLTGMNDLGLRTKKFRMDKRNADRIESDFAFDMKLVSADCGVFFSNTV